MVARFKFEDAKKAPLFFKEWRVWSGLSQEELADMIGTNKQMVSRIENGAREWGKGYLEAFSTAIGCASVSDPISHAPPQMEGDASRWESLLRSVIDLAMEHDLTAQEIQWIVQQAAPLSPPEELKKIQESKRRISSSSSEDQERVAQFVAKVAKTRRTSDRVGNPSNRGKP